MSINDFHDMMPDTVYHAAEVGRDDYGKVLYGSSVSYRARVVYKPTKVKAADGSEILARGYVWLGTYVVVGADDQITLPDSSTPPIVSVDRFPDEDGDHHTKIYFG